MMFIVLASLMLFTNFFSGFKSTITGMAVDTQTVTLNITVGVPQIIYVYNNSAKDLSTGPTEAPAITSVVMNFSVYSPSGAGNLNDSTAKLNISLAGQTARTNASCAKIQASGSYANYSCNVTMWWWDGTGDWIVNAYIKDNNSNSAINTSTTFYIGERIGFVMSPSTLSWTAIGPGATNQTSSNDPLLLNNTGNDVIDVDNIQVNATNLHGESDDAKALWAGNFSVHWASGGAACAGAGCVECAGTQMVKATLTGVVGANLSADNYTANNGYQGQEQVYLCLRYAGTELITQSYSTFNESTWTVKIV